MDHITNKLSKAGFDLMGVLKVQPTTTKIHKEKITHITSKLDKAGVNPMVPLHKTTPLTTTTTTTTAHHSNTKWIAIGAAIGGVLLLAILLLGFFLLRRKSRNRKAYAAVVAPKQKAMHDKDVFNADMDESQAFHESSEQLKEERIRENRLQERNYESGYDNVDTGYEGSGYDPEPSHGDKRAKYGA